jgi:hypothetical protein
MQWGIMMSLLLQKTLACLFALILSTVLLGFTQEPTMTDVFGGGGGASFIDNQYPSGARVLEVQVSSENWIDAVQVTYELPDGRTVAAARHGGSGGRPGVFRLDSDEYITGISGRYGKYIDSLRIHTNKRTSSVFGGPGGEQDYRIEVPYRSQGIGFIGRSGKYVDAIGLISIPAGLRQLTQSAISGGRGGSSFADQGAPYGARISEVRVQAAKMVDGIQAVYTLQDGRSVEGEYHGGRGGRTNAFRLDSDEYIVGIYGRYGDYIDSISIVTNKRTSPLFGGPGGKKDFRMDLPAGNMAIGFSGRSGLYLDAVGLIYTKIDIPARNPFRLPGRNRGH